MRLFLVQLLLLAVWPLFCASALSEEERHGHMRPREHGGAMRSPVVSGPTTGGKEDITGSNDVELAHANDVRTPTSSTYEYVLRE